MESLLLDRVLEIIKLRSVLLLQLLLLDLSILHPILGLQLKAFLILALQDPDKLISEHIQLGLDLIPDLLQVIVKVIHVSHLTGNCYAGSILCPDLAIIDERILR